MLHRIRVATTGNAAIETAIVFPTLLLSILVIIEVLWQLWVGAAMESAVYNASRLGMTGWAPTGSDRETAIMAQLSLRTMGIVNSSTATIQTLVYSDFSQIGSTSAPPPQSGLGGPGDVVVYTVTYSSPFLTPLQQWIGGTGILSQQASAVVRNEPWGGS